MATRKSFFGGTEFVLFLVAAFAGNWARQGWQQGHPWKAVLALIPALVLLLRMAVRLRNDIVASREAKDESERVGERIELVTSMTETGHFGGGAMTPAVLRGWREWVKEHPGRTEVKRAFMTLCHRIANCTNTDFDDLPLATREAARGIMEEERT
jgi:hypothetical protein